MNEINKMENLTTKLSEGDVFFNERETFLNSKISDTKYLKLTEEQKESGKRGTIEDAYKALQLRKDLQHFYDNYSYSKKLREWLEHYLKPKYENLEYELNNNGCGNLIMHFEDELDQHENNRLERILRNIKRGDYGDGCIDNNE